MMQFAREEYAAIINEIRDRLLASEILAKNNNIVSVESTSLQIRKILELIAYLSVIVNTDKLNHKQRSEYRANKIIESLVERTTIFYPLPCRVLDRSKENDQPILIPLGYKHSLTQSEFKSAYKKCGAVLHAQHPLKGQVDYQDAYIGNINVIKKLKSLIQNHIIGIKQSKDRYIFIYVEVDFNDSENSRPNIIREYNTKIYSEDQLVSLFNSFC